MLDVEIKMILTLWIRNLVVWVVRGAEYLKSSNEIAVHSYRVAGTGNSK